MSRYTYMYVCTIFVYCCIYTYAHICVQPAVVMLSHLYGIVLFTLLRRLGLSRQLGHATDKQGSSKERARRQGHPHRKYQIFAKRWTWYVLYMAEFPRTAPYYTTQRYLSCLSTGKYCNTDVLPSMPCYTALCTVAPLSL